MANRNVSDSRFIIPTSTQRSLAMNGSSDFATIPFTPDVTGFNFSFWVFRSRAGIANGEKFLSWEYNSPTDGFTLGWASNSLAMSFSIFNNGSSVVNMTTTQTFPAGKWYFVTITYKVNEAKLYVDGQLLATDTSCTMREPTVAQTLTLGRRSYTALSFLSGNFSRLTGQNTTTPWTQTQIYDLRWKNLIPSGATQWDLNNKATDQNGANALTLTGTTYSTSVPPHMAPRTSVSNRFVIPTSTQKSLAFNGSSDLATVPVTPDPNGFNLSGWIFINSIENVASNRVFISYQDADTTNGFKLFIQGSSKLLTFSTYNGSLSGNLQYSLSKVGWHHFTITFLSSSMKMYINGANPTEDTTSTMAAPSSNVFTIGKRSYQATYQLMYLSRLTFQNTATPWTQQQITDLYWKNVIPTGATQWDCNNKATDQNGANALTLTGTSYSTNVPVFMKPRTVV